MILFSSLSTEDQDRLNEVIATHTQEDIVDVTDGDILDAYESRFPRWPLLVEPAKCVMTLKQLAEKANDYYHHIPSVFEMFVLVRSMEDWLTSLEETFCGLRMVGDEDLDVAATITKKAAALKRFIELICPQPDLLYRVEGLINDALAGGEKFRQAGIKLEDYLEIVPPDVGLRLKVGLGMS